MVPLEAECCFHLPLLPVAYSDASSALSRCVLCGHSHEMLQERACRMIAFVDESFPSCFGDTPRLPAL